MTLHTADGCSINASNFTGTLSTSNCFANASGQNQNAGCRIDAADCTSYGDGFNNIGGGVYVVEWTAESIKIWSFVNGSVPTDIINGRPDPSVWGFPAASFSGCNIDEFFGPQQIVCPK